MHAEERNARQSRRAVGRLMYHYGQYEFTTNSIMLLDRHHDQHRRQEEDGEDGGLELPPARYSYTKRRRPKLKLSKKSRLMDGYKDDEEVKTADEWNDDIGDDEGDVYEDAGEKR
uniref:Uncharacterized protein n=1 Tax=Trichobilharzia regenti TaxID=157069 RepID=A0AA85KFL4_TRIRE|nr:unnamed protein product [Trichobilharzia regenti]